MEERQFSEQELVRREKMEELRSLGIDPFGQRFDITHYSGDIKREYSEFDKEQLHEKAVKAKVAGRIMTKRRQGKVLYGAVSCFIGTRTGKRCKRCLPAQ